MRIRNPAACVNRSAHPTCGGVPHDLPVYRVGRAWLENAAGGEEATQ